MRSAIASLVAVAAAATPAPALAGEVRVAVVAGANLGSSGDEPLRFAESDARQVRDVLTQLGGFDRARVRLLLGGSPTRLRAALMRARSQIAALRAGGDRVVFIFYFSGHGDHGALHLPAGELPLASVRALLASIPADVRISIVDACRTSATKGVRGARAFPVVVAPGPSGHVELWSAAPGEVAQESAEMGASVFSHFLTAGLRGGADFDRDRQITLAELYSYVHRKTLGRTARGTALQHPELRADLAGAGEVVISRPDRARAFLGYSGSGELLVFRLPSGSPVGELSGGSRLALPPGRFLVVRRDGRRRGVAQVDLSWGGDRRLDAGDFEPISREALAARGRNIELRDQRIEASIAAARLPGAAETALAIAGGWAAIRGRLVLGVELRLAGAAVRTSTHDGSSLGGGVRGRVGLRGFWERGTLEAFVAAEARLALQKTSRSDGTPQSDREQQQRGVAAHLGFRLAVALGGNMWLFGEIAGGAAIQRQLDREEPAGVVVEPSAELGLGVGYDF